MPLPVYWTRGESTGPLWVKSPVDQKYYPGWSDAPCGCCTCCDCVKNCVGLLVRISGYHSECWTCNEDFTGLPCDHDDAFPRLRRLPGASNGAYACLELVAEHDENESCGRTFRLSLVNSLGNCGDRGVLVGEHWTGNPQRWRVARSYMTAVFANITCTKATQNVQVGVFNTTQAFVETGGTERTDPAECLYFEDEPSGGGFTADSIGWNWINQGCLKGIQHSIQAVTTESCVESPFTDCVGCVPTYDVLYEWQILHDLDE